MAKPLPTSVWTPQPWGLGWCGLGVHSEAGWAEGTDIKGCRAQKWDAGVLGGTAA